MYDTGFRTATTIVYKTLHSIRKTSRLVNIAKSTLQRWLRPAASLPKPRSKITVAVKIAYAMQSRQTLLSLVPTLKFPDNWSQWPKGSPTTPEVRLQKIFDGLRVVPIKSSDGGVRRLLAPGVRPLARGPAVAAGLQTVPEGCTLHFLCLR